MKRRQHGNRVGLVNNDGHVIGIDIGATGVRAATLGRGREHGLPTISVHGLGEVALAPGVVVDGVVKDEAAVTRALKDLWRDNGFHCRNVVVGTTNQQVVVRELQVPTLTPAQRALALPFLAREVVALPLDQALLDFAPLGEPDPGTGMVSGLLIAAPRQPVLAAVRAVEAAGLAVARVDLASLAALRFACQEHLGVEAVVDVGAHLTSIVIHLDGAPKVVRTVARGGQELTDRLVDRVSLSPAEAEEAKAVQGMLGDTEVAIILREAVRPLLAEIRSSLHFFGSANPDRDLERISLTGRAAQLPGLAGELTRQHGVHTEFTSPALHLVQRWGAQPTRDADAAEFGSAGTAVSVGLAMGAAA